MKKLLVAVLPIVDVLAAPFCLLAALLLYVLRRLRLKHLPLCKHTLLKVGIYPLLDQYYEPLFNYTRLARPLSAERVLPAISWNWEEQLAFLGSFTFQEELLALKNGAAPAPHYEFSNSWFEAGDAEYWYSIIRLKKPKRIIEIGSGRSTLMARHALARNLQENPAHTCRHICIEPFENPWLETLGVEILRKNVETIDLAFFAMLEADDLLFIDSSHVIRPQGDVLFEYLQLLPTIKPGVIVHIHDIFSPRDYLENWLKEEVLFWNEQYLLEALLGDNRRWKVLGALNHLHHHHFAELRAVFPVLVQQDEPKSFYITKLP